MSPTMLILTAGLVLHAISTRPGDAPLLPAEILIFVVIVPKLFLAASFTALSRRLKQLFESTGSSGALEALAAAHRMYRAGVAGLFVLDLLCGLLLAMQRAGNLPLVDELFVVSLPLLMLAWGRWCTAPIDQRAAFAFADRFGLAGAWRPPARGRLQYVVHRIVEEAVPVLTPALLIIGWWEATELWAIGGTIARFGETPLTWRDVQHFAGPVVVLIAWPWVMRFAWDLTPLPPGRLREDALRIFDRARCRATQLLLWRTGGRMAFAAVMGGIPGVRFLIVSDGLVSRIAPELMQAVIAHEAAHLKKHHFLRMLLVAAGLMSLLILVVDFALQPTMRAIAGDAVAGNEALLFGTMGFAWYFAFGWMMRRFERQADVFAAAQLSQPLETVSDTVSSGGVITAHGAQRMIDALGAVALISGVDVERPTWRHGSIAWRQAYLRSAVGERVDQLRIDRIMTLLQIAALVALVAAVVVYVVLEKQMPV